MRQLSLLNEFRELISQLRNEVETASAMQLYDTHKISEEVLLRLFRELYDLSDLRNLNADQKNFPSIDLADDRKRVAKQVTSTSSLDKVKNTLEKFVSERLFDRYDKLIIYLLTRKQSSYSQAAIDKITEGKFNFSAADDIYDFQELCSQAANVEPKKLQEAVNVLKAYLRGIDIGLADEDIDPPFVPAEPISLNFAELKFPINIYIAELNSEILSDNKKKRRKNIRETIRNFCIDLGIRVPSAYVAHGERLITFFDLEDDYNPFIKLIEPGTAEPLPASNFYEIDDDHERVFKSLLRFSLQHQLFQKDVHWYQDEKLFVFLPRSCDLNVREESWFDKRQSARKVFERKFQKKDASKIFYQKHLAFSVDFTKIGNDWCLGITPDWFFSYGNGFERSGFADDNISWLKRQEINRSVFNHFRFIASWLRSIDQNDVFSIGEKTDCFLSFGNIVTIVGHPCLDESLWSPLIDQSEQSDIPQTMSWFG